MVASLEWVRVEKATRLTHGAGQKKEEKNIR
jgi:hypothetical protein